MIRALILLSSLLLLIACSPRYVVKTHYTKPITVNGDQCLQNCETKRTSCQSSCDGQYDICLQNAEQNAKSNLPALQREYDREMEDYYYEYEQYKHTLHHWERKRERLRDDQQYYRDRCNKNQKNKRYCNLAHDIKEELSSMYSTKPHQPNKPIKPTLDKEIKKFQKNCSRKCGCTKSYDNCFVSCGGYLHYEKICVENCN